MKPLLITLALLRGGDIATTHNILAHGGVEQNPLMSQSQAVNTAITGAELGGLYAWSRRHPTSAHIIAWVGIVAEGVAVHHNARVIASR